MNAVQAKERPRTSRWLSYCQLTKPTIVLLVLLTSLPALVMAGNGSPPLGTSLVVLLGTGLAAGGAGALNHYYDRDIDGLMERTCKRPIPFGMIDEKSAFAFGLGLAMLGVGLLSFGTHWLAGAIALASILYYVLIYTVWLKRRTPQNIVIGGLAGATAPLIGWAAIRGDLGLPPLLMGLVIFLWTPPHFWSLALVRRDDYARAGLPMLPVIEGLEVTRQQIVRYSLGMVAASLLLGSCRTIGLLYLGGAILLGSWFLSGAFRLGRRRNDSCARDLFHRSITYLLALFVLLTVDSIL